MKKILLLLVIPVVYFGFNSALWFENPVMIFDSPREYLNLSDFQMSFGMDQNLFSIKDIMELAKGSEVVLDDSKLELMKTGFKLSPIVSIDEYFGIGSRSFKLGVRMNIDNDVSLNLPYELMEVVFGKVGVNDSREATFNLLSGGFLAKMGVDLGLSLGKNLKLGISAGAYLPILWFDEDSEVRFFYRSDEKTATVEMGMNGDVRLLSAFSSLDNLDEIDTNELLENAGYYASLGVMMKFGSLKVAGGINDISIQPAKLKYEGYSEVSFEASLSNLENFGVSGPDFEVPDTFSELSEPESVEIPMKIFAAAEYETSFLNIALHFKSTTDFSEKEMGIYAGLANVLWIDLTNEGAAWKKTAGLNLDLRLVRLSASVGAIDYSGPFNFDISKMTGISASIGFGIGF